MEKKIVVVDGRAVECTVCPPSRRIASSRLSKHTHSRAEGRRVQVQARRIALDSGQIHTCDTCGRLLRKREIVLNQSECYVCQGNK